MYYDESNITKQEANDILKFFKPKQGDIFKYLQECLKNSDEKKFNQYDLQEQLEKAQNTIDPFKQRNRPVVIKNEIYMNYNDENCFKMD